MLLVIKGTIAEASAEAARRRVDLEEIDPHPKFTEVLAKTAAPVSTIIHWFCDGGHEAPFAPGTLLWYRE